MVSARSIIGLSVPSLKDFFLLVDVLAYTDNGMIPSCRMVFPSTNIVPSRRVEVPSAVFLASR